jgi:hypothetical protein
MSDLLTAQKALDDLILIHNELVITLPLIPIIYSEQYAVAINRTAELVRNFNVFKLHKDDNLVRLLPSRSIVTFTVIFFSTEQMVNSVTPRLRYLNAL